MPPKRRISDLSDGINCTVAMFKELFEDTKCSTVKEVMAVLEAKKGCIVLQGASTEIL
jgi:hypothetical protein